LLVLFTRNFSDMEAKFWVMPDMQTPVPGWYRWKT